MNADVIKVEQEESSDAASSSATTCKVQRPRRAAVRTADFNSGLLWTEEKELKKALYASLQESRMKVKSESEGDPSEVVTSVVGQRSSARKRPSDAGHNGAQLGDNPKRAKVHAQRKFAQGSNPTSPSVTPVKMKNSVSPSVELITARTPKTEDFLTFLCFRGTSVLPTSLSYFNSAPSGNDLLCDSQCQSIGNGDIQRPKPMPKPIALRGGIRGVPKIPPAKAPKSKTVAVPKKVARPANKNSSTSSESEGSDNDEVASRRSDKNKPTHPEVSKKKAGLSTDQVNPWSNREGILAQLDLSVRSNVGQSALLPGVHGLKHKYRQQRLAKHREALTKAAKKTEVTSCQPTKLSSVVPIRSTKIDHKRCVSDESPERKGGGGSSGTDVGVGVLTRLRDQSKTVVATAAATPRAVRREASRANKRNETVSPARGSSRGAEAKKRSAVVSRRLSTENTTGDEESKPVTRNAAAQLLKSTPRADTARRPMEKASTVRTGRESTVGVAGGSSSSRRTGRARSAVATVEDGEDVASGNASPLPFDHSYMRKRSDGDCDRAAGSDKASSPPPKFDRRTRSHIASDEFSSDDDEPLVKRGLRGDRGERTASDKNAQHTKKTVTISAAAKGGAVVRLACPTVDGHSDGRVGSRLPPPTPGIGARPATRQTREVTNAVVYLEPIDQRFSAKQHRGATGSVAPAVARKSAAPSSNHNAAALKEMGRRDAKVVVVPVDVTKKKGRRCTSEIIQVVLDTSTSSTSSASTTTASSSASPGTSPGDHLDASTSRCANQGRGGTVTGAVKRTSAVKTRDFMKKLNEAQFKLAQAQGKGGQQQQSSLRGQSAVATRMGSAARPAQKSTGGVKPVAGSSAVARSLPSTIANSAQLQPKAGGVERDRAGVGRLQPKVVTAAPNKGKSNTKHPVPVDPKRLVARSSRESAPSKSAGQPSVSAFSLPSAASSRPKAKRGPPVRKNVIRETDRKSARTKLFSGGGASNSDKLVARERRSLDLKRNLSTSSSSLSSDSSTTSTSSSSSSSLAGFPVPAGAAAVVGPAVRSGKNGGGVTMVVAGSTDVTSSASSSSTSSDSTTSSESSTSAEDAPSKPESTTISVRQNVASTSVAVQVNLINDISDLDEDEEFWEPGMIDGGETMEDFFVGGMDRVLTPTTLCKGYSPTTTGGGSATQRNSGGGGRSSWEHESPPTPLVLKMAAARAGVDKCRTPPNTHRAPAKGATPATPSPLTISNKKTKACASSDDESIDPADSCVLTAGVRDAPVFHPTADEFQDPLEYIEKIRPEAEKFGVCKIIPPASFKPECKVSDDMRFTAHNQYVHKVFNRLGPSVQEMDVIRKHLEVQGVEFEHPPLIGGMELDLPRLLRTVQQLGGLQEVIEKKKWKKVADLMKIAKSAQDRVTKLYDAYCRYLLSYDTLSKEEKGKLEQLVRQENQKSKGQGDEISECVTKGRSMSLSSFYRIARNTMAMWFRVGPKPPEVEQEYWRQVTQRQHHICVNAGNIDSSTYGYGFACNKTSPFAKHQWNLKVLTNNPRSILRCLGPVLGVTIPTLHVGMLFTTGCWYRDPHCLPWIEYLHTGASKIWYGVPASQSCRFREAMEKIVPYCCTNNPIWVPSDTAMVPPNLLVENGVSLCRLVQNSGQYVVVFPRAFTSTLCCGYSISESVYFATPDWLEIAPIAFKEIADSCEPAVFSLKRLLVGIAIDGTVGVNVLRQILPLLKEIREYELTLRKQLCDLGLNELEHIPLCEVKDTKKRASRSPNEQEHECDVCRENCYISMVINTQNNVSYCLRHGVEHLQKRKKDIKFCKLLFMYNETQLNELVQRTRDQLQAQGDRKKITGKKSVKKIP